MSLFKPKKEKQEKYTLFTRRKKFYNPVRKAITGLIMEKPIYTSYRQRCLVNGYRQPKHRIRIQPLKDGLKDLQIRILVYQHSVRFTVTNIFLL